MTSDLLMKLILVAAATALSLFLLYPPAAPPPPAPPFAPDHYLWADGTCLQIDSVQPYPDGSVWVWSHRCAESSLKPSPVSISEWRTYAVPMENPHD